jgi:hypothetical protein
VITSREEYLYHCYKGWQGFRCMKGTRGDSQQRRVPLSLLQELAGVQVYEGDQGCQPGKNHTSITATRAARVLDV